MFEWLFLSYIYIHSCPLYSEMTWLPFYSTGIFFLEEKGKSVTWSPLGNKQIFIQQIRGDQLWKESKRHKNAKCLSSRILQSSCGGEVHTHIHTHRHRREWNKLGATADSVIISVGWRHWHWSRVLLGCQTSVVTKESGVNFLEGSWRLTSWRWRRSFVSRWTITGPFSSWSGKWVEGEGQGTEGISCTRSVKSL